MHLSRPLGQYVLSLIKSASAFGPRTKEKNPQLSVSEGVCTLWRRHSPRKMGTHFHKNAIAFLIKPIQGDLSGVIQYLRVLRFSFFSIKNKKRKVMCSLVFRKCLILLNQIYNPFQKHINVNFIPRLQKIYNDVAHQLVD